MDIIQSKGVRIVPQLGGFHFLKSFLGTFGSISVVCYTDDADTSIVKSALDRATENTVEVRGAEDSDILIMLVHHVSPQHHPMILTTSKGRYSIAEIIASLTDQQKQYLLCHAFTGCDAVSSIYGYYLKLSRPLIF